MESIKVKNISSVEKLFFAVFSSVIAYLAINNFIVNVSVSEYILLEFIFVMSRYLYKLATGRIN